VAYYLSGPTLAAAVERLSTCRAKPSLCDFLIVKHAMTQGDGTVTLSLNDRTYMAAVRTLTAVSTTDDEEPLPPYFNPFGTKRERKLGWRTEKYPSNGPPDTVNGPRWKRVIDVISEGPRRIRFTRDYLEHLVPVIAREKGAVPLLEDCALWLHRSRSFPREEERDASRVRMVAAFLSETGLTGPERQLIFGEE
jgi:hypothetical protein